MLDSIFHVLAIAGIVLLCILAFLLAVIAAVLFVPIRYRLKVQKEDGWQKEKIHIEAGVHWLLGLVRVQVQLFEPRVVRAKLLFFTLFDLDRKKAQDSDWKGERPRSGKEKAAGKKSGRGRAANRKKREDKAKSPAMRPAASPHSAETAAHGAGTSAGGAAGVGASPHPGAGEAPDEGAGTQKRGLVSRIRALFQKILYTIRSTCDKIKTVRTTKDYYVGLLHSQAFLDGFSYGKGKLFKVVKHILPRRIKGEIVIGMKQPDQTGYILGALSIIRAFRGYDKLDIRADFEREIMEGKLRCSGRIRLFTLGIVVLQLYFNRDLREIRNKLKREGE